MDTGEIAVGEVVAVCTVHAVRDDPGRVGRTGVDKRARTGAVAVGPFGLAGDVICDEVHHGGPNKAVYAYAVEDARRWATELGEAVAPGRFGENLTLRGLAVSDAVIGQRWQIGTEAAGALLEVTMARTPCATFGRWLEQPHWVRRFTARGDTGAYLRVLRPGSVRAGDAVRVVSTPGHGVSVREVFTGTGPDGAGLDGAAGNRLERLLAEGTDLAPEVAGRARTLRARLPDG